MTANVPRVLTEPGSEKRSSDILRSTDQYRLDIQANPTVPILDISSQAPTSKQPSASPTAPSTGCATTCSRWRRQGIDPKDQVRLEQLGRARGGVINHGVGLQIALLSFLVVFTVSCCAVLFLSRVRRGWRAAARREEAAVRVDPGDGVLLATSNGRDGFR